jgi:N-acyl homoserine lactone hydrolase
MTTEASAPVRLYLMQVGIIPNVNVPIVSYLIQTADGRNILIDSGLPDILPEGAPPVVMGETVPQQLAKIGVTPADIDQLIITHFDMDHVGRIDEFTSAPWILQKAHHDHAQTSARLGRAKHLWDQPLEQYSFVEGDTVLSPGIELIATDGHVRGHQSVLVRLPETGAVLLTIDAIQRQELFVPDRPPAPSDEDEVAVKVTARKLLDIAARENVALTIFGHDPDQWPTLKKLPEFYN